MIIKSFEAKNFRNIEHAKIEFTEGVNLLIGKNAQGKTNIAEGIYLFSRGKSFRASDDKELIRFGENGFYLSLIYESALGEESLEYSILDKLKLRKKNGYRVKKITEMMDGFKCVLFVPDDLTMIKGGPEERRAFLNVAASQCYGDYIRYYQGYKTALENRNCILKLIRSGFSYDSDELRAWSDSLAEYAAHIYEIRLKYVKKIEVHARKIISEISGEKEKLTLKYKGDIDEKIVGIPDIIEEYKRVFERDLHSEMAAGYSLYGPHRDDIDIRINDYSSRSYASQGQQRSLVLALKLAEGEVIKEMFGEYPVFIFDDVMSELDGDRRSYIVNKMGKRQIIITSCEKENYAGFSDNIIEVEKGQYVSSHR